MRLFCTITILLATTCLPATISQEKQALFIKKDAIQSGKRVARQTSADQMVQNILQWLQGVYTQNSRRIRQGTLREYLPPANTQKPRPFEPPSQGGYVDNNFVIGYPPSGITPRPPFSDGGFTGYPTSSQPQPSFPPSTDTTSPTGFPAPSGPTGFPSRTPEFPTAPSATGGISVSIGFPGSTTGVPTTTTTSAPTTGFPTDSPAVTTGGGFTTSYPRPFPTTQSPTTLPTQSPTSYPSTTQPETQPPFTSQTQTTTITSTTEEDNFIPTEEPLESETTTDKTEEVEATTELSSRNSGGDDNDDLSHPPHIHAIDVECSKEMMTINLEFNREFDGIIYSKGFYNNPECRYVKENSRRAKYSFTVNLNSCGTQFRNAFDTEGKSYLENVIVLQNEPGIQEVWDTIRSVRCLWEGNLKKALNVALSVGMLNQEIVTFSGDTAMARLDIQLGRGPFAPPANGLVKIGEVMTLVVSVSGDPGFDIQVKDCRAKDSNGGNVVALTDERGCVLKPKLFGAFQKTRNTGSTGASIIAYAFFNAFKFPDVMDLVLECNVDLCKTDCEMCTEPNQKIEPGRRRRRDLYSQNVTNDDSVTMGKMLRVILPEDLNDAQTINFTQSEGVCMSTQGFILSSTILISLLSSSCLFSAYMWLKYQRLYLKK